VSYQYIKELPSVSGTYLNWNIVALSGSSEADIPLSGRRHFFAEVATYSNNLIEGIHAKEFD